MKTNGNDLTGIAFNDRGVVTLEGLTKRELFAAMAMQGMVSSNSYASWNNSTVANQAVAIADALIAGLNKEVQQ